VIKEKIKIVPKVWGQEIWLVNNESYCCKLLEIAEGAQGSYHYHKEKKETFWCIEGEVLLIVEDKKYDLHQMASPKTIMPGEKHSIYGFADSVIIEVSTPHSEEDVVRLSKSHAGYKDTVPDIFTWWRVRLRRLFLKVWWLRHNYRHR